MSSSPPPKGHVVVIPLPCYSHVLPLFNLVRDLANSAPSVRFSWVNTLEINSFLFPAVPNIRVYHYDVGLGNSPEHLLKSAKTNCGTTIAVAERDTGLKVGCLLTDAFMLFACDIAEALNAKWVPFWFPAPYALPSFLYLDFIADLCREHEGKPGGGIRLSSVPGLSAMYLEDLPLKALLEHDDSQMSIIYRSIRHVLPCATTLLLNSYEEANPEELVEDLKSKFKVLLHVGCRTVSFQPPSTEGEQEDNTGCLSWLNKQEPKTVAYICFGTVKSISPEEIRAVATALEEMRTPFLWSLKEDFRTHFPQGFLERTTGNGKVVPWAPQSLVLGHKACGVYVTHCGYHSVFESVAGGVPMICRPIWADNMMNARMVEEVWRIGIKVELVNGAITAEGMAKCLRMDLGRGEEGKIMRERITEFREKLAAAVREDGSAGRDFRSLVELISCSDDE